MYCFFNLYYASFIQSRDFDSRNMFYNNNNTWNFQTKILPCNILYFYTKYSNFHSQNLRLRTQYLVWFRFLDCLWSSICREDLHKHWFMMSLNQLKHFILNQFGRYPNFNFHLLKAENYLIKLFGYRLIILSLVTISRQLNLFLI